MCIRDRESFGSGRAGAKLLDWPHYTRPVEFEGRKVPLVLHCLLYTSDAADERSSVDLGGRRIIKKKNTVETRMGECSTVTTEELTIHVSQTDSRWRRMARVTEIT